MRQTDRQTDVVRQKHHLMPSPYGGGGITTKISQYYTANVIQVKKVTVRIFQIKAEKIETPKAVNAQPKGRMWVGQKWLSGKLKRRR